MISRDATRGELVERLLAACRGRSLTEPAFTELCRLVWDGDDFELRSAVRQLEFLPTTKADDIKICLETTTLLLELLDRRDARLFDEIQRRIIQVRNLAWALEQHRMILPDFKRRAVLLLDASDPEMPEVRLFSRGAVEKIIADAIHRTKRRPGRAALSLLDGGAT